MFVLTTAYDAISSMGSYTYAYKVPSLMFDYLMEMLHVLCLYLVLVVVLALTINWAWHEVIRQPRRAIRKASQVAGTVAAFTHEAWAWVGNLAWGAWIGQLWHALQAFGGGFLQFWRIIRPVVTPALTAPFNMIYGGVMTNDKGGKVAASASTPASPPGADPSPPKKEDADPAANSKEAGGGTPREVVSEDPKRGPVQGAVGPGRVPVGRPRKSTGMGSSDMGQRKCMHPTRLAEACGKAAVAVGTDGRDYCARHIRYS